MRALLITPLFKFANRLRFRNLFLLTGGLFVLTLLVPDLIPFADEIVLGLVTLVLSRITRKNPDRREPDMGEPIDLPADAVRRG